MTFQLRLIIDANVLIAALIKDDVTAALLYSKNLQLFAPSQLLVEVRKYKDIIKRKSGMDDEEFKELLKSFKRRITFIENEEFIDLLDEADKISPDEGDAPYVALSLKLNVGIWSNDKALKDRQDSVMVYNTNDVIVRLRSRKSSVKTGERFK